MSTRLLFVRRRGIATIPVAPIGLMHNPNWWGVAMMLALDVGWPRTAMLRVRSAFTRLGVAALLLALAYSASRAEEPTATRNERTTTSDADYARKRREWMQLDREVDAFITARDYESARDKAYLLVGIAAEMSKPADWRSRMAPALLVELKSVCELDSTKRQRYTDARDRLTFGREAFDDQRLLTANRSLLAARNEFIDLLGNESISVWDSGNTPGIIHFYLGFWVDRKYWEEGRRLAEQQSVVALKLFGQDDPQYGGALAVEAGFNRILNDHAKALPLDKESLRIRQTFFGNDHVVTAHSLGSLGMCYAESGDIKTGEAMLRQRLKLILQSPTPDEGELAITMQRIAQVAFIAGRLDDAAAEINDALKQLPNSESGDNRQIDLARVKLLELRSTVCERQGDKAGAAAATEEANKIRKVVKAKISR